MGLSNLSFSATNINVGKDADKPVSCKPGDIYISTDTEEILFCVSTDTWTGGDKKGTIKLWYGETTNVPNGWVICDGTNGTPDLRGKVPVGVDTGDTDFNTVGKTGGSKFTEAHEHNITMNIYAMTEGRARAYGTSGASAGSGTVTSTTFGTGDSGNLQPYLCLHYIMKL